MQTPARDEAGPAGTSGAQVVIAIFGALAVLIAIVLIGFTLFEPESAPCASGDMATNPLVNGQYQPRTELFASVEDAEAFICRGVPELHAEGWALERIEALRTLPIEFLVEGDGLAVVTLGYLSDATGGPLTLDAAPYSGQSYFESLIPPQRTEEAVQVRGIDAVAYRYGINPDQVEVLWQDDSLEHRATVQLDASFTLDDFVELLNTLR